MNISRKCFRFYKDIRVLSAVNISGKTNKNHTKQTRKTDH